MPGLRGMSPFLLPSHVDSHTVLQPPSVQSPPLTLTLRQALDRSLQGERWAWRRQGVGAAPEPPPEAFSAGRLFPVSISPCPVMSCHSRTHLPSGWGLSRSSEAGVPRVLALAPLGTTQGSVAWLPPGRTGALAGARHSAPTAAVPAPPCTASSGPLGSVCSAFKQQAHGPGDVSGGWLCGHFHGEGRRVPLAGSDCWVLSRRGRNPPAGGGGAGSPCPAALAHFPRAPAKAQPCPPSPRGGPPSGQGLGGLCRWGSLPPTCQSLPAPSAGQPV